MVGKGIMWSLLNSGKNLVGMKKKGRGGLASHVELFGDEESGKSRGRREKKVIILTTPPPKNRGRKCFFGEEGDSLSVGWGNLDLHDLGRCDRARTI